MTSSSQSGSDDGRSAWRMVGEYTGLAVTLPGAVVIGYIIGFLLDRVFHTGRVFTIVFLFLGGAAGLVEIVRVASNWQSRDQNSSQDGPRDTHNDGTGHS